MPRPPEYDREDVLEKAMNLFWERGFNSVSMPELSEAMDMRPGSIYAAFKNKESLLMATMDMYASAAGTCCDLIVKENEREREVIKAVFDFIIDEMAVQKIRRGCLLVNIFLELSTVNESIGEHARKHLEQTKEFIRQRLQKAQESGELSAEKSVNELTSFLFGIFYSLRVMGKARAPKEELEAVTRQALSYVFDS